MSPHSSATSSPGTCFLIVSFHDVAPGSRAVCDTFVQRAAGLGIPALSLLVVPRWHGGPSFDADGAFVDWLRAVSAQGHEICHHGYTHWGDRGTRRADWANRFYTAGEAEFHRASREDADRMIRDGADAFRRAGLQPRGFIAPAWLMSPATVEAAREAGFVFSTTWGALVSLDDRRSYRAPALVFSSRTRWRRVVSAAWVSAWYLVNARSRVLRIVVHPRDLEYPWVERFILRLVARAGRSRQSGTHGEVFDWLTTRRQHA